MEDVSNYHKLREDAQKFYSTIWKITPPAFNEPVHFTSEGFDHILFKSARTERDKESQILRFKLLPRALKLIKITSTYQEFDAVSHKKKMNKIF